MRRGVATFTLDYGKCPPWLFERMVKLGREMARVCMRTHLKNPISAAMTGFSAASRSSLLTIAKLFLARLAEDGESRRVGLHGFRSKIPHFATKAIFEMGSI